MARYQQGYIFEAFNAFHVRYYVTEIVDGKPKRVQRSQRLCAKDNRHHSTTCKPVQQLAVQVMQKINTQTSYAQEDVLLSDFWATTYWPHLVKSKKASTLCGYEKLWSKHLEPAFVGIRLREFTCRSATLMLTALVENKNLGRRSLSHAKSLASGMFRHAKQLGLVDENPFADAQSHLKPKAPEDTPAYSLDEAETISNALIDHPQEQLIFCLSTFMGLRPGESAALKWEDISVDWIHIRRAVWRRIIGDTKTPDSVASIPLIEPLRSMFAAWRFQAGSSEWVFPNGSGQPMLMQTVVRRITQVLKAHDITWRGLYAGRRAAGSLLCQLTGNAVATQYVLRHSNLATTTAFYIKPSKGEAETGMRLLEKKLAERIKFKPAPKILAAQEVLLTEE